MDVFTIFEAAGLWAGLKAMRLAWDPHLRRIASVSAFLCALGLLRSAMSLVPQLHGT
jgi:hypothetical protein